VREHDGITFQVYRAGDSRWCFGRRGASVCVLASDAESETVIQLAICQGREGVKRLLVDATLIVAVVGGGAGAFAAFSRYARSTNEIRLREREIAGSRVPVRPQRGAGAMHETERVLVVGGTGGTGLLIAHLLLQSGYRVRVLARNPIQAARRLGSAVEVVPGDVTQPHNAVECCAGHYSPLLHRRGGHRLCARATHRRHRVPRRLERARRRSAGGISGRFLYMTAIGVITPSLSAALLNLFKGQHAAMAQAGRGRYPRQRCRLHDHSSGVLLNSPVEASH